MTNMSLKAAEQSKAKWSRSCRVATAAMCMAMCSHGWSFASTLSTSNFAFVSGTPVSGTSTIDGTTVVVTSSNTFKNPVGTTNSVGMQYVESELNFLFDTNISSFSFTFSRLRGGEYFTTTLGAPTEVTNDFNTLYFFNPSTVTGFSPNSDFGQGTFRYDNLLTNTVSIKYFTVGPSGPSPLPGNANITQFGFAAVPLPSSILLMLAATGSLGFFGRLKRKLI